MSAFAWHQVVHACRLPAVWVVIVGHAVLLVLYLLVWGDGLPLAGARRPFEQFSTAHAVLLVVILPWVAARCLVPGDREAVSLSSALSGRSPLLVVAGYTLGLMLVLAAVTVSTWPLLVFADQASVTSGGRLVSAQTYGLGLSCCVAAISTALTTLADSRLVGWLGGATAGAALTWALPGGATGGVALALLAVLVASAHSRRAGHAWQFLPERVA